MIPGIVAANTRPSTAGPLTRTNILQRRGTGGTSLFTPPNNCILVAVVAVCRSGSSVDPSGDIGISGGGLTWTSRLVIGSPISFSRGIRIFTAPVGTAASMNVTPALLSGGVHTLDVHLFAYENANMSSPTGVSASSAVIVGGTGPQTLTLSGAPSGSSEVLAVMHTNPTAASSPITPTSPWIEQYDIGGSNIQIQTQTRASSTSTLVSWSGVGATFGTSNVAAAIEIRQ